MIRAVIAFFILAFIFSPLAALGILLLVYILFGNWRIHFYD